MMTERMPATDLEATGTIGRYVNLTLLGQGGMGAVYRGRDPELERPVAIKVMLDSTPDFVARFRREAQSIARLTHANIVQVYDFGVDDQGNPYFVMELIDGTPLDKIVRDKGRLPPMEAIRIIRQAAEGLSAAHRAGIVHRDVKPSNLIVDGRGTVKLVDFGIARVATGAGQALTGAAALMGTPGYMAPEQAAGRPVDHRADIYALGLTLFELLSGEPPYSAADPISLVVKNMQEPLPDLRVRDFGIPDELVTLVEMMGQKSPDDRLQSCDAVVAALDDVLGHMKTGRIDAAQAPTDRIPPTNVHQKRPDAVANAAVSTGNSKRPPVAILVGVGLALVGLAIGAILVTRTPKAVDPTPTPPTTANPTPPTDVNVQKPGDNTVVSNSNSNPNVNPGNLNPVVNRPGQGTAAGPLRVAVLKFKNIGADAQLAFLEQGIGETALTELSGSTKAVQLIERNDIDSDISEIDRAGDFHFDAISVAKLGQLKGIEYAVQGGFQKAGSKLRITARFVRVETGEVLDTLTVTRGAKDPFKAQDEVAAGLKDKLLALAVKERK
jgi:serine/threonine protein kinase